MACLGGMSARGSGGAPGAPPAGSGAEPQPLRHFCAVSMPNLMNLKLFYTTVFRILDPTNTVMFYNTILCIRRIRQN